MLQTTRNGFEHIRGMFLYIIVYAAQLLFLCSAIAQDTDEQQYLNTVQEAIREFKNGYFEEAFSLFRQAYAIQPNAQTSRGMGMAAFEARKYVEAIVALQAALDHTRKPLSEKRRAEVENLLDRARKFVGYVDLRTNPASASVTIDGREPSTYQEHVLLDPGTRQIVVKAEGFRTLTRQITVTGGESKTLEFSLEPLETQIEQEPEITDRDEKQSEEDIDLIPWIVLGGSGAVMLTGGILLGFGLNDLAKVENANDGVNWTDIESASDRAPAFSTAGFVLLGVGAAGLITGVLLLTLNESDDDGPLSVWLKPNGIALRGAISLP